MAFIEAPGGGGTRQLIEDRINYVDRYKKHVSLKTSPVFPLFPPSFFSSSILAECRGGRAGGGEGHAASAVEGEQSEGGGG